jgi:uncharacterized protein YdeI (YjbR/CyaY-like superfamily)
MNPKVDKFLGRATKWQKEMEQLRKIALDCGLEEELKWGKPCYALGGKNIVVIQGFAAYCAYLFFKGYLLNDPAGILVKTGENTVVGRQIRFTTVRDIVKLQSVLKSYIYQAIEVEKSGVAKEVKKPAELKVPEEFQQVLDTNAKLKKAFLSLTQGRQKAYCIFFSQAKQSATRLARIEKSMPQILKGKGINE